MGGKSERVSGTEKPLEDIANGKTVELQIEI